MKRSTLAARLIREGNNARRKKLLDANLRLADASLARELKDYCYRVWTSAPADTRKASAALRTLAEVRPDRETIAIQRWVDGIADIASGRLESAVSNLDSASRNLSRLDHEHESAQPLVAKLIALAMLGRYTAAQLTGEKALRIFTKYRDELAAGKIEMNLSNIVSRRDQYRLAEKYCSSAFRRFKKLGERGWQTMAENGLANTYAELNDFKRAEEFYKRALENARELRMHVTVAEIEASMGNLALFRGRFGEAIRMLELSRRRYEKLGMPHQSAVADLEIADIYGELNLTAEADEIYRRVIPVLRRLKMRAEEARARANFGRTLIGAEDFKGARTELRRAAELFERERNPTASAAVRLRIALLEVSLGKFPEALALAESLAVSLGKLENTRLRLSAQCLHGEILAKMGRHEEAEVRLDKTLKESRKAEQSTVTQSALNSLGVIARERGRAGKAVNFFESAIEAAESARAPLPGEEFRMAFLAKSLEPYENLTRLYLDQGEHEKAFVSVERARSRSLLDAVGSANNFRKNDELTKLREELNWFYSRLARVEGGEARALQAKVRDREKKLTAYSLRAQISAKTKATNHLGHLDLSSLQKQIGEDRALIEFVEFRGRYSVFVVTDTRLEYVNDVASEKEILTLLEGLHFQFGSFKFGAEVVAPFAAQLKERADAYLERLHAKLLRPVLRSIEGRDLTIVPAGALNYVPFHALFDGAKYLLENNKVSYAPSAAVWKKLDSKRKRHSPDNALLMAFADESIPLVNSEVAYLAKLLPHAKKLMGKQSTFTSFQTNARDFDLIHLACHGQFRPDNPMFSSLHLADGWVTVRDVCAHRLNAQLVTLSACETGLSKIAAGEEILGLARGFLSAGARSLLLSLWNVNDEATTKLMGEVYSNLQRGTDISASLRVAQKGFIDRGEHPYYWSSFFVIG